MTDTPAVHGTPSPHGHGIKGFMTTNTAGMPNWVWLLVIAGGVGLALGVKYFYGKKSGNASTTGTTPDSGLGLAIDPTTGLPYAVEGLVPAGGTVGNNPPPPVPTPTPTPTPTPVYGVPGKDYGLVPFGHYTGPSFSNLKPNTHWTYQGVTYTLQAGAQGRLWGINPHGDRILLYEPVSFYPGGTNYHGPPPPPQTIPTKWPGGTNQVRVTG